MKRNKGLLLLLLASWVGDLNAQTTLPNLIPPSPISAEFTKYQEFRISPYNGLPEISIPLHVIKVNGLEIPLSLSYHASGIKTSQTSGEVGVGWNINSNYRISRTIFGRPDEHYKIPSNFDSLTLPSYERDHYLAQFIEDGAGGQAPPPYTASDGEFDIFSYGAPTEGGMFIINDRTTKTVAFLENALTRLSYINTVDSGILSLTTLDAKGNRFDYGREFVSNNRVYENSAAPGIGYKAPTAWPLMKIITNQGGEEINFKYYTANTGYYNGESATFVIKEAHPQSFTDRETKANPNSESSPYSTFFTSSIETPYEKVFVVHRTDMTNLIDSIIVRTADNTVIKRIAFCYSNPGHHWFLDSVRIFGNSLAATPQVYKFTYYNKSHSTNDLTADSWGYYKGAIPGNNYHQEFSDDPIRTRKQDCATQGVYPPDLLSQVIDDGVFNNRDAYDAQYNYSLEKIVYPTSGSSTYFYESNKYLNRYNTVIEGGGLRIQKIVNTDPVQQNSLVREYRYGENENGIGIPVVPGGMGYWNFKDQNVKLVWTGAPNDPTCPYPLPLGPLLPANEYVYSLHPLGDVSNFVSMSSGNVRYTNVNEYVSSSVSNARNGKTNYKYAVSQQELVDNALNTVGSVTYVANFQAWDKPRLIEKGVYSFDGTTYNYVQKEVYDYLFGTGGGSWTGLKVQPYASDLANGGYINDPSYVYSYYTWSGLNSWYKYGQYTITSSSYLLKEKQVTEYTPQGTIVKLEKYSYNASNQLSSVTASGATEGFIREEYKYATDFTGITGTDAISLAIKNLQTRNVVDAQVEKSTFRLDASLVNKGLMWTSFNVFRSDKPYLNKVLSIKKAGLPTDFSRATVQSGVVTVDSRYSEDMSIDAYDLKGRILQVGKTNDIKKAYIWPDNVTAPVAEAVNASYNEIFFDSFEKNEGWEGFLNFDNSKSHSGRVSGRIDNASTSTEVVVQSTKLLSISLTGTKQFTYSGWFFTNGPAIDMYLIMRRADETAYYSYYDVITPTLTTGKWMYVEKKFTVPADVATMFIRVDNNGGGNVWFDDIRLHPSSAQMTTYTYDPLIGMTSHSDVNSKPTYYEYDGFGRLALVRDQDRNIIKKICYNYAGQPEDCH